ncbi:MAG: hypothetical protein KGI87_04725 [Burkholderiales bacterium]|nr:hypothetical protein [Burkholderiales bacterium]
MPYYLYRVLPFAQLEKLDQFDTFKLASMRAKALRAAQGDAAQGDAAQGKIKVMFADNEQQAEDLLCQVRTAGPSGDD